MGQITRIKTMIHKRMSDKKLSTENGGDSFSSSLKSRVSSRRLRANIVGVAIC